jgi:hypothetical protein
LLIQGRFSPCRGLLSASAVTKRDAADASGLATRITPRVVQTPSRRCRPEPEAATKRRTAVGTACGARHGRHGVSGMRRAVAVTVGVVMLGVTAGCGRNAVPANEPTAIPNVVDVVCSPAGVRVSGTRFTAQRDGLHIRVQDTSGASGVYLTYQHGPNMGLGGGQPVDSGTILVLGLPPGPSQLACSSDHGRKEDRPIVIEVLDPARAWQTGALARLGCSPPERSLIDWVYRPGRGSTAEAALAALAEQLGEPTTWRHVQEGYVAAATQTYVMQRAGTPWATASVTRWAPGEYGADLGSLC